MVVGAVQLYSPLVMSAPSITHTPCCKESVYDLTSVSVPVLRGMPLKLVAGLLETPLRGLVTSVLSRKFGVSWFRKLRIGDAPTFYPVHFTGEPAGGPTELPEA